MTDNDVKTRPVPHQPASAQNPRVETDQLAHDPLGSGPPMEFGPTTEDRRPTFMNRVRTPVAAAVGGGILILGVGFGAGFAVGHGLGGGQSTSQTGPGGQGFGGQGMGGGPGGPGGGTGQLGQTGQGQTDQGLTDPGQLGQSGTGTGTDTSFAA